MNGVGGSDNDGVGGADDDIGDIGETAYDHGEPRVIDVYNGRDFLGSIAIGRSIRAITPEGVEIGRYSTQEEARRAVVLAAFERGAS